MKVEEGGDGESGGTEKYSRDLLQRLSLCCGGGNEAKSSYKSPDEDTEELELSLGLSLGGKFGIEKRSKRLARSASVATVLPLVREEDVGSVARLSSSFSSIIRTSSLPTEPEEEFRKRKEWQSLRRLEAKRRRCEKQRKGGEKDCGDGMTINSLDKQKGLGSNDMLTPFGVLGSAAIAGQGPFGVGGIGEFGSKGKEGILSVGGIGEFGSKGKEGILSVGGYGLVGFRMVRGHGSVVEAQHGSSSASGGWSDSDGRPTQGSCTSNETKSPASNGLSPEVVSLAAKPPTGKLKEGERDILPRQDIPETKPKVQGVSLTEDSMPCVFTKGDGPNGIRVDGILYKYGKGEEVRIMCICHGNFLSPAEFVRHAGGEDVANPHRHIFINTSTLVSR